MTEVREKDHTDQLSELILHFPQLHDQGACQLDCCVITEHRSWMFKCVANVTHPLAPVLVP